MKLTQQPTALNILLADDDNDDCFLFAEALREIPIATRITTVHDGDQLMSYLAEHSEHPPDILFLDLSMPRKTGFECLTEIKENEKLKAITVVVFTTSFGRSSDFEQNLIDTLLKIGAEEYIRKPNDFAQLKEIIRKELIKALEKNNLRENSISNA